MATRLASDAIRLDVREGSKPEVGAELPDVGFAYKNGHQAARLAGPFGAKPGSRVVTSAPLFRSPADPGPLRLMKGHSRRYAEEQIARWSRKHNRPRRAPTRPR
jgi:hypothetical protein